MIKNLRQGLSRRDGLLILMGASVVYVFTSLFNVATPFSSLKMADEQLGEQVSFPPPPRVIAPQVAADLGLSKIPETTVVAHAPGWTLFRNLYMSNGTLFLVSSNPENSGFPKIRMMTSTGLIALNNPENIRMREPTDQEMQIIDVEEATARWGGNTALNQRNRILTVEGKTLLVNEPWQFLNHYYHFVAELMFGAWAFMYGAFNPSAGFVPATESFPLVDPRTTSFNLLPSTYQPPALSRIIFMHATAAEWRDKPGFNTYFLRAAFPSLDVEVASDWYDRANATWTDPSTRSLEKAWHFPMALLSDRSASFRGEVCGAQTQRIAAESWAYMAKHRGVDVFGQWWTGVRESVYRFANVHKEPRVLDENLSLYDDGESDPQSLLPEPEQVVITYINRQGVRRHLIPAHHAELVGSMQELVRAKKAEGKNWIFKDVKPELLSKDEQVKLASESTIMLGVHGNGLTHLVLMEANKYSSVIEIFYPGGFAHDYEWTSRSLGMRHYSVWNDTVFTYPNEPPYAAYPEGFQGSAIPVHGPTVAKLVEDRLEGRLHY